MKLSFPYARPCARASVWEQSSEQRDVVLGCPCLLLWPLCLLTTVWHGVYDRVVGDLLVRMPDTSSTRGGSSEGESSADSDAAPAPTAAALAVIEEAPTRWAGAGQAGPG